MIQRLSQKSILDYLKDIIHHKMLAFIKRLYFSKIFNLVTIPFKVYDFFFRRKQDKIFFYGYHGRYTGNAKALYEYYLKYEKKLTPVWLLDNNDKDLFMDKSKIFYLLPNKNSGLWEHFKFYHNLLHSKIIILTSIGDLHIYKRLLLKYKYTEVLLPHGIPSKSGGILAKHLSGKQKIIWTDIPKRFDIISVCSRVEQYWTAASTGISPDKLKIVGPQRRDLLKTALDSSEKIKIKNKIITKTKLNLNNNELDKFRFLLYAPTHRDHIKEKPYYSLLQNMNGFDIDELDRYLFKHKKILFLREHFVSKNSIKLRNNKLQSIIHLTQNDFPDLEAIIPSMDLIITDYSGIYFELLKSDISIAFLQYDLEDYEENRGLILPADILKIGYSISSQSDLLNYLENQDSIDERFRLKRNYLDKLLFEVAKGDSCRITKNEIDKTLINS